MNAQNDTGERREIEELLPWHAAGTLSRRDAARVEAALAQDEELAREYEATRDELAATINLNESLGAPSPRAMDKLFAAIDAETASRGTQSAPSSAVAGLTERISEFFAGFSGRTLAWSATAAAVVILAQAAVITNVYVGQRTYEIASAPASVSVSGAPELFVGFAPQASVADITRLLESFDASIIAGPLPGGLYRVRVDPATQPLAKDLNRLVARLSEERAIVTFAGPAR